MKKIPLIAILSLVLSLLLSGVAAAQTSPVAGEWAASMNTPGGTRPFGLVFKVEGEKLTGTVKRASGDVPLEGTIKGTEISFAYTINYNERALSLLFSGQSRRR